MKLAISNYQNDQNLEVPFRLQQLAKSNFPNRYPAELSDLQYLHFCNNATFRCLSFVNKGSNRAVFKTDTMPCRLARQYLFLQNLDSVKESKVFKTLVYRRTLRRESWIEHPRMNQHKILETFRDN